MREHEVFPYKIDKVSLKLSKVLNCIYSVQASQTTGTHLSLNFPIQGIYVASSTFIKHPCKIILF